MFLIFNRILKRNLKIIFYEAFMLIITNFDEYFLFLLKGKSKVLLMIFRNISVR